MPTRETTEEDAHSSIADMETQDLFEMATNLFPDTTGLPMTVWVSPRGNAHHDVRVKVNMTNMTHGEQMEIGNTAIVGVRATPRVIAGQLSPADIQAVVQWIELNAETLVALWDGRIDTARMIYQLKSLPAAGLVQTRTP